VSEPIPPLLLRFEEAGRVLGVGRTKVFELVAAGELEAVSIGSARRIPTQALAEYVAHLRAEAHEEAP
jgi:excisionase family DNA binding protein